MTTNQELNLSFPPFSLLFFYILPSAPERVVMKTRCELGSGSTGTVHLSVVDTCEISEI